MRIVFMTSGTIKSSISYRPLSLAKELVKKGHDVYIFAPRFDKYSKFKDEGITEIDGVKIVRPLQLKTFSFELGLIPYILSSAVMLHKLKPDIVHIYKPNPITITGLLPKFTRKTSIILDTDDLDSEVMKMENNPTLKIKLVQLSEKIAAYSVNAIITGSKFLQDHYITRYKAKKVIHIPNGADFINTDKISLEKISNNRIIFIGALNRVNILEPLFYAISKLKNDKRISTNVIIMGDGKYLNYFKKLTEKLGLNKNVKFLGWVPQNELYKHVQTGDIGYSYMPNELTTRACSSMKVFQYMQYGSVPLVSNVGDLPYYIDYGNAGYIAKHNNSEDLIKTILSAIKQKKERIDKIKHSTIYAPTSFSWKSLAEQVEAVYKSLIENKI